MTKTTVKSHARKGTRGVKRHSRTVKSKREVPSRRDVILSPKEIASIRKIIDKNKMVKKYSIKRKGYPNDYIGIDIDYKSEEIDFGAPPGQPHEIEDFSHIFNITKSNDTYELTAYRSYHFRLDHKFSTLYRKKVKKFSTITKNIEKTMIKNS